MHESNWSITINSYKIVIGLWPVLRSALPWGVSYDFHAEGLSHLHLTVRRKLGQISDFPWIIRELVSQGRLSWNPATGNFREVQDHAFADLGQKSLYADKTVEAWARNVEWIIAMGPMRVKSLGAAFLVGRASAHSLHREDLENTRQPSAGQPWLFTQTTVSRLLHGA